MILARLTLARSVRDIASDNEFKRVSGRACEHIERPLIENTTLRLAYWAGLVHLIYAEIQFLQLWLVSERGFSPRGLRPYGQVYLLTALPASILGGVAADWLAKRNGLNRVIYLRVILTLPFVVIQIL